MTLTTPYRWLPEVGVLHGGRKQQLVDADGRSIATIVQLPGTLTRGYLYRPYREIDEPTWELCKARVSDETGFTTHAYKAQKEADAILTEVQS